MGHTDTFARFVRLMEAQLDAAWEDGPSLAGQLYLSRSHLDRIVAAVAGETAGRFRRRILLERAAYRLRTSGVSILDAAVEAGFGSGEAFARAFRQAYGAPPTRWRAGAGAFQLAAPNGVHFYPPAGLRLPARTGVTTMTFVPALVDHHVAVLGQLLDRAETLADDQLDAPVAAGGGIDDAPTIRSLLARLVMQLEMWQAAMANEPYDHTTQRHETPAALRARLERAGTQFRGYVRGVAEQDRYDETFVDATTETPYVFTAASMIAHILTYAAYRRTVVVGAMAAAGAPDIEDDPLTWFGAG